MDFEDTKHFTKVTDSFDSAVRSFVDLDLEYFEYLRNRDRFYVGIEDTTYNQTIYNRKKKLKPKPEVADNFNIPSFPRPKPPKDPVRIPIPTFDPVQIQQLINILLGLGITWEVIQQILGGLLGGQGVVQNPLGGVNPPVLATEIGDARETTIDFEPAPIGEIATATNTITETQIQNLSFQELLKLAQANLNDPVLWAIVIGSGLTAMLDSPAPGPFDFLAGTGGSALLVSRLLFLLRKGRLIVPAMKLAFAQGGYVQNTQTVLVGEGGETEFIIPASKFGRAIEAVYREGASVMIAASVGFLNLLPSSSTKTSVLNEANRLKQIFGLTSVKLSNGGFSLGQPLKPFSSSETGSNTLLTSFNSTISSELSSVTTDTNETLENPVERAFTNSIGTAKQIFIKGAKLLGIKDLEKTIVNNIPMKGLAAGLIIAGQRVLTGDLSGAGLELLSGMSSMFRGGGGDLTTALDTTVAAKNLDLMNGSAIFASDTVSPTTMLDINGNPIILNPSTMSAWQKAVAAAAADGVDLPSAVTSSYRTPEKQQELINRNKAGDSNVYTPAAVHLSPHVQGWAVDINYYDPANEWMRRNGHKFGFKWAGDQDPVHFDFWNNEPNDKWLQPGNRDWIPGDNTQAIKKTTSVLADSSISPVFSGDKNMVNNMPVTQSGKSSTGSENVVPIIFPIPIVKTVTVPFEVEKDREISNHIVIEPFSKGSREVVG
jgi:hypothetical protein